MDTYSHSDWVRLGSALRDRRGELGYSYGKRKEFARDTGARMSPRSLQRIEQAERDTIPAETFATIAEMYAVTPESMHAVLDAAGALQPAAGSPRSEVTGLYVAGDDTPPPRSPAEGDDEAGLLDFARRVVAEDPALAGFVEFILEMEVLEPAEKRGVISIGLGRRHRHAGQARQA